MKITATIDGERVEVELMRAEPPAIEARISGRHYLLEARTVEPGVYWFNWNNRSMEISVVPNGEGYVVSVNGLRIPVEIVDARNALRKAAQHGGDGVVELRA